MVSWQAFPSLLPRAPLAISLAPKTPFHKAPFPFPFKRLPRRLFSVLLRRRSNSIPRCTSFHVILSLRTWHIMISILQPTPSWSQSNSNERSPPTHPLEWINFNKRLPRGRSFLQSIFKNLALLLLRVLLLAFIVLLQNKHTSLAENGENLISAQPRISSHSQGPKI